jgi:NADH dehydrogenase FAD-containing subunit
VIGEQNIFVSGDARPMGFSKSGNTSNTEAKHVARLIAAKVKNEKKIAWQSPVTVCISLVSINPERGIFIHSEYAYNKKTAQFAFATPVTDEIWQGEHGKNNAASAYDWAESMFVDMFG